MPECYWSLAQDLRPLFETLESKCSAYCVLAGYETFPDYAVSDIDFMVSAKDLQKLPEILKAFADENGMRLVQSLQHEIAACYFILARVDGSHITYLHPDPTVDYRRHDRLWMSASAVLSRRRPYKGFWIPAPEDAFLYYLVKRIDKRLFDQTHGNYLSPLFAEDPKSCVREISRLLPASSVDLITRAARTGDWSNVVAAQNELASQLISFSPPAVDRNYRIKEFVRKISRNLHPTGLMVVCLGPDGAGKSTALSAMKEGLEKAFRRTAQFHLRPKMLKGTAAASQFVADPHGKPNRGILTSILKVIYFCLDYWVSYFARLRPMLVRSTFVLFDRYFYDLQVDQRRYRYSGPTWLVRMLSHLVPAPDLVLVFDAPADQIHARKQELPLEELSRQRELYRHFAASRRRCPVRMIDASKPIDEMISQCFTEVLTVLEARTHKRLNLDR